jgi:hypothetical protein
MLLMNQFKQICGALFVSSVLAACGGGGGGSSAPPASGGGTTPPPPTTVTKNFTASVSEIDVSQTSTGESVVVDASGVTASGTVEVTQ